MQRIKLKIYGKVQGIFFRSSAKDKAEDLGLVGWVRNALDDAVELLAEGKPEKIKELVKWCKVGPQMAQVDKVEEKIENIDRIEFLDFRIEY